jgi:hypothetical protein
MFAKQQNVFDPARFARFNNPLLQRPRFRVAHESQIHFNATFQRSPAETSDRIFRR